MTAASGAAARAATSVLLVDDHAVVREGYRRLLERHPGIEVIGEADSAEAAFEAYRALKPAVVVMDITLPGASGIEVMRRMLQQDARAHVLIFSMHEDVIFARHALQSGALGYVTKSSAPNELVDAVRTVAAGGRYVSAPMAQKLVLHAPRRQRHAIEELTMREFEVLQHLARGHSVREIAQSMGLTPKTVANHQSVIKQKLGAESNLQLLRAAQELGLS